MLDSITNQDYMSSYKLYIISHVFLMCLRTLRTLLWSVLNWWIPNILKYWRSLAFLRLSGMLCLCSMEMGNISFSLYETLAVSPLITISLAIIWQNMLIIEIAPSICIGARILLGSRALHHMEDTNHVVGAVQLFDSPPYFPKSQNLSTDLKLLS